MKAIFYSLLFENDRICFEYFKDGSNKSETKLRVKKMEKTVLN